MSLETTLFVGGVPGGTEMVVILLIAILLFGANKIPKLARSTGQAIGEFQRGRQELEQELEDIKEGPPSGEAGNPGASSSESATETATETATDSSDDERSGDDASA